MIRKTLSLSLIGLALLHSLSSENPAQATEKVYSVRGDVNQGGYVDLLDAVEIINYVAGGSRLRCLDAADANDDGRVGQSDAVYMLTYLYQNGPPPAAPFPSCGLDLTFDFLSCQRPPAECSR